MWGRHGENQISGIDLTLSDDEDPPVATLTAQPAQVSEGEAIEVEIRLSLPYGGNATSTLQLIVTDADGALVAPLPTGAEFESGELTHAITLTAADNAVHNDGARVVTVALAPNPDASLYTLGAPSSATVVVADNDNVAPVFSDGASATRSVAENTAAGENVGAALTATDTDAGDTLTYTLEGADAVSFDIVSTSGQIRTRPGVTYDHEAKSSYSVTVKADDGNAGTATIAVTVTVTDVAEPPAAPAAPAVTATSASTTSLDVTWTAPANPGKPAISGYGLRYRVGTSGSWTDGPQNRTGASASIASLTAGTSYQVQVRATNAEGDGPWSDSGTGSTGTSSNTAPTFANPTATRSVPENSAADTNVGAVVTATDTDAGDTLTYTLEGAGAASFDIVSTSGQIRTRPGVTYDHEARSSYSVTVKADDGNAGTATTAVTITVTDVAEPPAAPAAPAVTATSASTTSVDVTWTAPANPGKPAISGYDLRYRAGITGSWTDGPQNRTGASASIASLAAGTSYQVQVRATNAEGDGPWSDSGTGSTGTPSNAAPTFANPTATRSVPENSAAGTNVGAVVTATDTDAGDTLTYTLEGAGAASFDIVSTSGQIRTRPGVTYDHEAKSSYSVTVKADDGNAGNATVAVTITVTDVAEPPSAPAAPAVTATSASTTSVDVTWTAPANPGKPAISGYGLRYRVGTSGSWTDGPQNRTGASASIASLAAGTSYQVQVRATNAEGDGPWSASGTGSTGTSSNAAPTFANPTAGRSVPENSAADTNVGAVVTATDTDAGDTLTYTLEGADAASFDIVSTSGQIRTRSGVTYDHETKSSYSVTVKADDGNAGTATVAVTVTVTDVAEPPAAPGAPTVTATSASTTSVDVAWSAPANPGKPDISGYDLRYRVGTSGSWADGPQNRTGASASIASLTAGTSYQVQVRATNAEGDGPWSDSGTGSTGTPSNAAPTFANPTATRSVPENSAAGTNAGAVVTATDTDAGDTLTYTLEGAGAASFDIVSTSGQIRTRPGVTYDHEARSSYSVTVKADDGNAGNATTAVTITVTDVAEPPAAPAAPAVTATSASTTSVDVTWTAPANPGKPAISGYDLRYRAGITGSWTDGPQNRTGASASIASLTAGTSYQVQVRATNAEGDGPWSDSGSGSTGTSSNAAPTFANPTATRSVPENSAAGTNVGAVVTATDTDVGDTLAYTLEGADAVSFDIVSTSGQIRTRPGVTYDHEAKSSYSVTVKADDGNAGTATIAVTITVTDVAEPPAAPAAPTVTATSASTTSLDVTWTAPANPGKPAISGYDLRYRVGTSGSWTDGPQNRTGASASIASLTAGTSYQVQVRATNAEGDGPWSASGSGSTGTSSNAAPDAPRSLTAEGGNQEVTLRWLAPASNGGSAILRYQYRRRYGSQAYGNWTDIANSAPGEANGNSYTVTGLLGNAQYRFEVRAVNTGGPGAESNEVVETPVPVTKLRASQKAWIARFDRTVATQVVDAIGARFSGGGTRGVTVGGQSLNRTGGAVDDALARNRLLAEPGEPGAEPKVLSMDGRELLLGSSFSFGGGGKDGAPSWGAWGRFATGGFEADADGMRVEGDVTTGLLGADASRGRWLAGVAVSLSRGEGPFRLTSAMESNRLSGTVESSLTALYPYAKLGLSDRMEAWGLVGLGTGELTVRESGGTPIETDLGMTMGAVGTRGRLLSAGEGGGLDLALRSDAMWVRMKSDAVSGGEGNLAAAQALVSRLRLIVEGSRTFAMADERTITPRGEIGVRHDLGDAETGTGLEVGAGVKFAGDGFSIEGAVRALVAHEDAHYREWGASGAIRVDPGAAGRGLSLSIAPTWGNAASAAARLWSARDAGGLVRADDFEARSRLEAELGYGVGAPHGPGLVTPYAGLTLSDGARRALRTGVRWNAPQSATVSLEASREGQGSGEALTLRAEVRW